MVLSKKNMKNQGKSIKIPWNVFFSPGHRLSCQIWAEDRGSTRHRPAKGWGLGDLGARNGTYKA